MRYFSTLEWIIKSGKERCTRRDLFKENAKKGETPG